MNLALLAQDAAGGAASGGAGPAPSFMDSIFGMLPMLLIIWFIFWFVVFRPQKKQQAALKEMLAGLKKGDAVRTRGGLLGVIAKVDEHEVLLRVDQEGKVRVRVARDAIEPVYSKDGDTKDGKT